MEPHSDSWPWKVLRGGDPVPAQQADHAGLPLEAISRLYLKPSEKPLKCPECGTEWREVQSASLFGCPACLDVFADLLDAEEASRQS